jgi:tetratricopeptide (TPR) repeat protein
LFSQTDSLLRDSLFLQEELQAIETYQSSNNKAALSHVYYNIGDIYSRKKEYQSALENYMLSLITCRELNDQIGMATCFQQMANTLLKLAKYAEAIRYYSDAIDIYEELGSRDYAGECALGISSVYEIKKNIQEAIAYTRKAENYFTFTQNAEKIRLCKERIKYLKTKK